MDYNFLMNKDTPLETGRIVSVDFFRGLAIFAVALIHSIMFGVFYTIDNTLAVIPLPLLIVLAPLVLLAPLAGLFAFISATAKVFISQKRLTEGHSLKSVLQPILITSAALLVLHFLYTLIFRSPSSSMFTPGILVDSFLSGTIRQWKVQPIVFESFLYMNAMAMVCVTGLITAAALAIWNRKRPSLDRTLRLLTIIGILSVFAAPFVWALFWKPLVYCYSAEGALRLLSIPLSFLSAKMHCLPGIFPFVMFGLWFGFLFAARPTYNEVIRRTRPLAVVFTILFFFCVGCRLFLTLGNETALWNLIEKTGLITVLSWNTPGLADGNLLGAFFDYRMVPTEFHFFGLMIAFWGFPVLLRVFDYCDENRKKRRADRIRPIIRFGTLSLTVFFLEPAVNFLFSKPFHLLLGGELSPVMNPITPDRFMLSPQIWFLFPILILLFWGITLKFWENANYRFSLEWFFVRLTSPFRKIKSEKLPPHSK